MSAGRVLGEPAERILAVGESWVECTIADWRTGLRGRLDLRKELFAGLAVPPSYELPSARGAP